MTYYKMHILVVFTIRYAFFFGFLGLSLLGGASNGQLEWRTIELKKEVIDVEDYQGTSVMNYADQEVEYTRIHEPKHLHPRRRYNKKKTVIFYEYSTQNPVDHYYPIRSAKNIETFQKYQELAKKESNLIIGGRLGDYAYYDMDKTIAAALKCYEKRIVD